MSARITWEELREKFPEIYERERNREAKPDPARKRGSSVILLREAEPGEIGPWVVLIPGWQPPSLNRYLYRHWTETSKAKRDVIAVVGAACLAAGIPRATKRRRVSVSLTKKGHRPDHDNITKALYDGLKACGAILDDGPDWCETGRYEVGRGELKTTLTLEDA